MKIQWLALGLLCMALGACSSSEPEQAAAPDQPDAATPGGAELNDDVDELEQDTNDFLTDLPEKDDVLADATVDEDELFSRPATPEEDAAVKNSPVDELFGAAPSDAAGEMPADAAAPPVDDFLPAPDRTPPASDEPVAEAAPVDDELFDLPPLQSKAEDLATDAPGADDRAPAADPAPLDDPLADLFGDKPAAAPAGPRDDFFNPPVAAPVQSASEAATAAMQEFFIAMRAGDLETAEQTVFSPAALDRQELVKKQVAKMAEMMIDGSMRIETVEARAEENWVLIVARIFMTRDGQAIEKISDQFMIKQDGRWKMVPETIRADAAVEPLIDENFGKLMTWYGENKAELRRRHLPLDKS